MAILDAFRDFVRRKAVPAPSVSSGPSSSVDAAVQVAACALFIELAHADGEFTSPEREHIELTMGRHFGLDEPAAKELLALAERERQRSVDHYQFTRLLKEQYDVGQRMVLAEVMWGVILADGVIADHEAALVRRLGSLLDLEPAYLSQARQRVVERTEAQ